MMNNKGNILLGILFFVLAMGVVFALTPVIRVFIDMEQQSNNLNCYGYVYNGNPGHSLSYNATIGQNSSGTGGGSASLACSAIKLYIPYILLVFLIFGVSEVIYMRAGDFFTGGSGVTG